MHFRVGRRVRVAMVLPCVLNAAEGTTNLSIQTLGRSQCGILTANEDDFHVQRGGSLQYDLVAQRVLPIPGWETEAQTDLTIEQVGRGEAFVSVLLGEVRVMRVRTRDEEAGVKHE
jgi:hypothetical protein